MTGKYVVLGLLKWVWEDKEPTIAYSNEDLLFQRAWLNNISYQLPIQFDPLGIIAAWDEVLAARSKEEGISGIINKNDLGAVLKLELVVISNKLPHTHGKHAGQMEERFWIREIGFSNSRRFR